MIEALNDRFSQTSDIISKNVYFFNMVVDEKVSSLLTSVVAQTEPMTNQLSKLYIDLQKQRKKVLSLKTKFIEAGNTFNSERNFFFGNFTEGSKTKYKDSKKDKNYQRIEYINCYVIL